MSIRPIAAALLGTVLLGAGNQPSPLIVYSAPAGTRPTGADGIHPTTAILPNGRIAAPVGMSVFVGRNPLGLALSPNGRYAIVSNNGGADALPSLAVVDTQSMRIVSVYRDAASAYFMGIACVTDAADASRTIVLASDPAASVVRFYLLDTAGQLVPAQAIALPLAHGTRALPGSIAISDDNRTAYVVDNAGDAVVPIDIASRTALRPVPVGNSPFYVAAGRRSILVTAMGLATYGQATSPTRQPQFALPPFDPSRSSTLTVADISGASQVGDPATVRMDPAPDGAQIVGGAAPGATVVSPGGELAYVALSNIDRIAVVALNAPPRVVRGLDLRLYPGAPYGAQPSAEALSADGKRLYVALAGLNAVAVLDALRPTRYRYGLVPTAWYPTALSLSRDGRYLYVVAAKGVDASGILQRIDLKHTSLVKETLAALRYARTPQVAKFDAVIPPLRSLKRSAAIDHVVYVAVGTQTYDAMLGDLQDNAGAPHGNGNPSLLRYAATITPNLHALAREYGLADNFYASDMDRVVNMQFGLAADATLYQQLGSLAAARSALDDRGDDPEDYQRTGDLFNAFARAGLTFRDYGGLLRLSGYDGTFYHKNTPALAALSGNVDPDFAGWNPQVSNVARADEFVRDMQRYVQADRVPNFSYVWLPSRPDQASVSDADRALGKIVDFISHTAHWSSTAIFVVPEGVEPSAVDHVNRMRSYALVVSPLARRGYAGADHLSAASVVKTEEEIFGLPPLALNDLLASDLSDFFSTAPAPQPYQAR